MHKKGDKLTIVSYNDVIAAFNELFNSKTVQVLQSLQKMEVIAMLALFNETTVKKLERVSLDDVHERSNTILNHSLKWSGSMPTH